MEKKGISCASKQTYACEESTIRHEGSRADTNEKRGFVADVWTLRPPHISGSAHEVCVLGYLSLYGSLIVETLLLKESTMSSRTVIGDDFIRSSIS